MTRPLALVARHGRLCLVAGLVAGIALPGLAAALRPHLPQMVALLLFVAALRIGPRAALGSLTEARRAARVVLIYQLALPLTAVVVLRATGVQHSLPAAALTLVLAAPSVTGSPNFTILLGHDPAPALRVLVLGTAALPLTVLPVLLLSPGLGDAATVLAATARLLGVIAAAVGAAFLVRFLALPVLTDTARQDLDGAAALLLGVVVIGLMAALGPALAARPVEVAWWTAAVFAVNFGLQGLAWLRLRHRPGAVALSIIAGNRNVALFLVALPAATMDPLLVFVGCYQLPMYLTPILLRRLYRPPAAEG